MELFCIGRETSLKIIPDRWRFSTERFCFPYRSRPHGCVLENTLPVCTVLQVRLASLSEFPFLEYMISRVPGVTHSLFRLSAEVRGHTEKPNSCSKSWAFAEVNTAWPGMPAIQFSQPCFWLKDCFSGCTVIDLSSTIGHRLLKWVSCDFQTDS